MTSLGDLGTPHAPHDVTFGYFGTEVRVHPDMTDLGLMDLVADLQDVSDGAKAVSALRALVAAFIHPGDLDAFWATAKANRQTTEDLSELALSILSAVTDRPTRQPSDSSDGLPSTATRSTDDSSSQALRLLAGRPDLQVAVLREREAG